jgi:hypothetical protein
MFKATRRHIPENIPSIFHIYRRKMYGRDDEHMQNFDRKIWREEATWKTLA